MGPVLDGVGHDDVWKTACIKHQELALQTKAELSKDGTQFNFGVLFDMMLLL